MNDRELTPWFPVSMKPVRDGYYEVLYRGESEVDERDKRLWRAGEWWAADEKSIALFGVSGDQWRGLAKEPK